MRYTVYNKAMKRPVFQTNDLDVARHAKSEKRKNAE